MKGGPFYSNPAGFPEKRAMGEFAGQCLRDCLFQQIRKAMAENRKESQCSANQSDKREGYSEFPSQLKYFVHIDE